MGSIVLFLAIEKSYVTLKCNSHFRIRNGKIELVMRMVTRTTKSNEPAFFNGAKNSLLSPTNFKKCNLSQISVRTDFCIAIGWYIGWPIIGFAGIENAYHFWPNDGYKGVLLHPIPLLEIFLFFEIWHFLIKSSDFGDWAHQGGFLC